MKANDWVDVFTITVIVPHKDNFNPDVGTQVEAAANRLRTELLRRNEVITTQRMSTYDNAHVFVKREEEN